MVSVVGAVLPLSALTPKDRIDLAYGLELGADGIALSFVQRPEDVEEVRAIVAGRAGVMSKLEKPSAVEHLDAIVALSDAVMVARGVVTYTSSGSSSLRASRERPATSILSMAASVDHAQRLL